MAVPSTIEFRDLNQWLELHQVVSSPVSDTTIHVWGRFYPTSLESADVVIHNGFAFDQFTSTDWLLWYFIYAGHTYVFEHFDIIDGGKLVSIGVTNSASLDRSSLSDLVTFDSDSDAATAGIAVGAWYRAGSKHERADYGSATTRIT